MTSTSSTRSIAPNVHADTTTLLFDMDGVILEGWGTDPAVHTAALDEALAAYGVDPSVEQYELLDRYEYTNDFETTCDALGLDAAEFYAARETNSATRAIDRLRAGTRGLYDDASALDALADQATLGLVSNNYHSTVSFVVEEYDLEMFAFVRGRDESVEGFRRRKPDPHYLREGLTALGVDEGLYVGDRETDLLAAARAGLDSVYVRRDHNDRVEPSVEPTHEIERLDDLLELV
ncbi:HAD family hydrolase [Haloferacaceae archaeon DSL9]